MTHTAEPTHHEAGTVLADADANGSKSYVTAPLRGRHVHLRIVTPADYQMLQIAETGAELGPRWRYRGSTPGPEEWVASLWSSVLAQFLVVENRSGEPLGIVSAYKGNFRDRFAYIAAARFGTEARAPLMMLGLALFIRYVFTTWDLRKLYLEVPEFNLSQFSSVIDKYATVEGRLRDHLFSGGHWWDEVVLAIYRDVWTEHGDVIARSA
jgi:RimJ/RimL family protein N-acetyltransferase